MNELPWMAEAKAHIGTSEIAGARHNSKISGWLADLKAWWRDDETPWCGTFVAHCLHAARRPLPQNWFRALAWKDYGTRLKAPAYGCIAVKTRKGGGHVFFVVGKDARGRILGLGGNQGNKVSIVPFELAEIDAFVWPNGSDGKPSAPNPARYQLGMATATAAYGAAEA